MSGKPKKLMVQVTLLRNGVDDVVKAMELRDGEYLAFQGLLR